MIKRGFNFSHLCWNGWKRKGSNECDPSSSVRKDIVSKMLSLLDLGKLETYYIDDVVQISGILTTKELMSVWKTKAKTVQPQKMGAQRASGGEESEVGQSRA